MSLHCVGGQLYNLPERYYEQATRCRWPGCKKHLVAEPPPRKKVGRGYQSTDWSRVSIRCVYCYRVFCPKHAEMHFRPEHIATPCAKVTVEERPTFVVLVGRTPIAACPKKGDALRKAMEIRESSDSNLEMKTRYT